MESAWLWKNPHAISVRTFPRKIHYHLATEFMWETEDGVQRLFFAPGESMFFAACEFSYLRFICVLKR